MALITRLVVSTQEAVDIWLAIPAFWLALSAYEIGAILTHRFHTISYLSAHHPWLAWTIAGLAVVSALIFAVWFKFYHTEQWIPW